MLLFDEPEACAKLKGSEKYPSIQGKVFFYSFWQGTLIAAMVTGLPFTVGDCSGRFFGFHLHEGGDPLQSGRLQPSGNSGDKITTGEVLLSADC